MMQTLERVRESIRRHSCHLDMDPTAPARSFSFSGTFQAKGLPVAFFLLYDLLNKFYYISTFFKEIARLKNKIWLFKVTFSL